MIKRYSVLERLEEDMKILGFRFSVDLDVFLVKLRKFVFSYLVWL